MEPQSNSVLEGSMFDKTLQYTLYFLFGHMCAYCVETAKLILSLQLLAKYINALFPRACFHNSLQPRITILQDPRNIFQLLISFCLAPILINLFSFQFWIYHTFIRIYGEVA